MDYATELKKYLSVKAVGKTAYIALDDEPFKAGGELYTLIYCDKGEIKIESDDFSVVMPKSHIILTASGKEITLSAAKKEAKVLRRKNASARRSFNRISDFEKLVRTTFTRRFFG